MRALLKTTLPKAGSLRTLPSERRPRCRGAGSNASAPPASAILRRAVATPGRKRWSFGRSEMISGLGN